MKKKVPNQPSQPMPTYRHSWAETFGKIMHLYRRRSAKDYVRPIPTREKIERISPGRPDLGAGGSVEFVREGRTSSHRLPHLVRPRLCRDRGGHIWLGQAAGISREDGRRQAQLHEHSTVPCHVVHHGYPCRNGRASLHDCRSALGPMTQKTPNQSPRPAAQNGRG